MLQSQQMSKVCVYATKKDQSTIISALHKLKIYHLLKPKEGTGIPLDQAEAIAQRLNKIQSLYSLLGVGMKTLERLYQEERENGISEELTSVLKKIDLMHEKVTDLATRRKELESQLQHIREHRLKLEPFTNSPLFTLGAFSSERVALVYGHTKDIDELKRAIAAVTKHVTFWENGNHVIIAYDSSVDITPALRNTFTPYVISLEGTSATTYASYYTSLVKNEKALLKEMESQHSAFSIHEDSVQLMARYQQHLKHELEKQQAPLYFLQGEASFVIEGYIPTRKVARLKSTLDNEVRDRYHLVEEYVDRHHEAPIALQHPKTVSPFDFFVKLYSLPSYKEIDPTFFTFISFPIIFGAILGDFGYGLFSFFLFMFLKSKLPNLSGFFNILIWSSVWTIIFGIFFAEFFGAEILFGYHMHPIIHRLHAINELMVFSLVIGLVHINMGFILGFVNEYRHHGLWHAFAAKLSWLVLQSGIALAALSFMGIIPLNIWIGVIISIAAVVLIAVGEGMAGIVELPGLFGNILSYLRIMAIGLASAGLAIVVNDFAAQMFASSGAGIIFGVLTLMVGHAINILLGLFGPFLHTLRLHYVEQFTKFYKGGGTPYKPFGN